MCCLRWYLRFGLSYRDVEDLLAERGIEVDYVTVHRWVQRLTPLLADAARFGRHWVRDRWHVDETYVKVAGPWVYLYRAVDQYGKVVDVYASTRRNTEAARRLFQASGLIDLNGILGLDGGVRNGYEQITVRFNVKGHAA